jgi:hypothetical protein
MLPHNVFVDTLVKGDCHLIQRTALYALRTMVAAFMVAGGVSTAQAACAPDGQGGVTNTGGSCTVVPPVNRITATGSGTTTAAGVTLAVPYGIAVTASGGASVNLQNGVAGPSAISAPNGGGLVALFATGVSSQITADSLNITLSSGGGTPRHRQPPAATLPS